MDNTKSRNQIDMLHGPLLMKIIVFTLPLAASSILQQLFNSVDVAVVGRFASSQALAAVGSNTPVISLLINLFMGVSMGANVIISNHIGQNDKRSIRDAIGTVGITALVSGLFLMVLGISVARPILTLMNTPADVLDLAVTYLRILANTNVFLALSTGIRQRSCDLKWNKISVLPFPLPSLPEQRTITTYLDEKCGEIDTLISLQEEMISELQAYKQSVITEAVTKGLDSNVPMKDSGVEWIGMIPEGWKIQRLRTLGNCQNGISKGGEYFGDEFDFPFVNYTDAYKNIDVPYPEGRANSTEEDRKQYSLIEGDILFTRTSETIDEIGYASTCTQTIPNAVFSGFLIRFRPTGKELYYGFSKYYFRSSIHRAFFVKGIGLLV